MRSLIRLALSGGLIAVPVLVSALTFSDVPKTGVYAEAIMSLSDEGVITGNPDGTFLPHVPVNRAAFLAMAYRAAKINVGTEGTTNFRDVPASSWFAPYVRDAVSRGFVKGYEDGSFKPSAMVSLSEAVKISYEVLSISREPVTAADVSIVPFTISADAWYAPYIINATRRQILPLPDHGSEFRLNDPIARQEAAVLLFRAKKYANTKGSSSISSSSSSAESSVSSASSSVSSRQRSSASSSVAAELDIRSLSVPASETAQFTGKETRLYKMAISSKTTVDITVALKNVSGGQVSCRLYHLVKDGLAPEYYLGIEERQSCTIRATLGNGVYQLELRSNTADAEYSLKTAIAKGDGNDGLIEASPIKESLSRGSVLNANDLEDWYSFKVSGAPDAGLPYNISFTSDTEAECMVQPWTDVVVFGEIPVCNKKVMLTNGTYYIRIKHKVPFAGKSVYTLILRKE